jgi:hypothetical protein
MGADEVTTDPVQPWQVRETLTWTVNIIWSPFAEKILMIGTGGHKLGWEFGNTSRLNTSDPAPKI